MNLVSTLQRSRWRDYVGVYLTALVPLLYVYMPRPPIDAARFLVFPAIGAILGAGVLWFIVKREPLERQVVALLAFFLAVSCATCVSFLLNASTIRATAMLELVRPLLFAVFLLFGYYIGRAHGDGRTRRGLLIAARLIIVGQLVLAVAQILGIASVGLVYSEEKMWTLGSLLRATGSLGNPNLFAWVVTQAVAVIYACDRRRSFPWVLVGALLVLASGSRSILLLFPFAIALTEVLLRTRERASFIRAAWIGGFVLAGLLTSVFWFADVFPYLAQLRKFVEAGSLTSIGSFAVRVERWQYVSGVFADEGNVLHWLVGLGSTEVTRLLENDYLYVFFRLGILGFVAHWTTFLVAVWILYKARRHPVAIIGIQYFVASLPVGLLRETLGGWHFPLLFFYYVGLSVGVARFEARHSIAPIDQTIGEGQLRLTAPVVRARPPAGPRRHASRFVW